MKKINILYSAFTLIELIVVISIITLLSSTSVFYFIDFINNRAINIKVSAIEGKIGTLDSYIKQKKIYNYEVLFNPGSNNKGYKIDINNFDINESINVHFDSLGKIINVSMTSTGILEIYKGIKLDFRKELKDLHANLIDQNISYKISGEYRNASGSLEEFNTILLEYFGEENIDSIIENDISLSHINTQSNNSGVAINELIISNINNSKTLIADNIEINKAYLTFEYSGLSSEIIISK